MYAFMGKILLVNLTEKTYQTIDKDDHFYRQYMGGSLLAAQLFTEHFEVTEDAGPFSSKNPLIFATGPLAGGSVCGVTRVNVLTISPETTGIYLSQAGGEFGPEMKRAGFDAVVVIGKASSPVYLKITTLNQKTFCDFLPADHLWGKDRVEANEILKKDLPEKYSMASIGPAGEKLVAQANIMFELDHYAGRGGLGAVMGAKNLKAICLKGDQKIAFKDPKKMMAINKVGAKRFKESDPNSFGKVLRKNGTFGLLALNQDAGNLPTKNFKHAQVDSEEYEKEISHSHIREKYVGKSVPCRACYLACKKQYKQDSPWSDYTVCAEYESIALLAPNIGLETDFAEGLRACEICNRLGIDTMSAGDIVSWLMDCFENQVLTEEKTGFSIKFGDGQKACELVEDIALRKGPLGDLLASGIEKSLLKLGEATRPYLRFSKGIGFPAHMPRRKPGIGFGYLHGPNPADHMKLEHDWIVSEKEILKGLGLNISSTLDTLDKNKVEIARATQCYYSMVDVLSSCMFVFGPGNIYTFTEITEMVNAATGFDLTFKELLALGERSIQIQRKIYCDLGGQDEEYLPYLKEKIPAGAGEGYHITEKDFKETRAHYYSLWGWDEKGVPKV